MLLTWMSRKFQFVLLNSLIKILITDGRLSVELTKFDIVGKAKIFFVLLTI